MRKFWILVFITSFHLSCLGQYPNAANIVLLYKFENNLNDSSGKEKHCLKNNGAVFSNDRFGNDNASMYFNGNSYIDIPDTLYPKGIKELTVAFWYKNESHDSGVQHFMVYVGSSTGEFQTCITNNRASGAVHLTEFTIWRGTGQTKDLDCPDDWHFYTMVFKRANSLKLYIDGVLQDSIFLPDMDLIVYPHDIASYPCLGAYCIGTNRSDYRGLWKGSLDDVFIYNISFTDNDIKQLMNYPQKYDNSRLLIEAAIPDSICDLKSIKQIIPIVIKNKSNRNIQNSSFRIAVSVPEKSFISDDSTLISYTGNGKRYFILTGDLNINSNDSMIYTGFKGYLCHDSTSFIFTIDSFEISEPCYETTNIKNGKYTIHQCQFALNEIQINKNISYGLYDSKGIFIRKIHTVSELNVDNELSNGIYFLINQTDIKKMIIIDGGHYFLQ